jgi:WD40 repeat protein
VNSIQFTNKNEYLAGGLGDGIVKIWDLKSKEVVRSFKGTTNPTAQVNSLSFN